MRIVLSVLLLVLLPTACFFGWAWLAAIARERKLQGTLPAWQDLPWTWLIITGLALAIVAILYLVLATDMASDIGTRVALQRPLATSPTLA